eukprot:1479292-Rhodomonas_salina.4
MGSELDIGEDSVESRCWVMSKMTASTEGVSDSGRSPEGYRSLALKTTQRTAGTNIPSGSLAHRGRLRGQAQKLKVPGKMPENTVRGPVRADACQCGI